MALRGTEQIAKGDDQRLFLLLRTVEQGPFDPMWASQTEARRRHFSSRRIVSVAAGQTP
jgi:hypothetical protein